MKNKKITSFRLVCLLIATIAFIFLANKGRIIILLVSMISAILFGRLWCGYVCPLGFYQEILSLLRKKLHIPTVRSSYKMKKILQPFKWIVLLGFLIAIIFGGLRPILFNRPDLALTSGSKSLVELIIIGIITGVCFLNERAFCKYCPLGTLRGIANKVSLGRIKKNGSACTHCRACLACCPMEIRGIYEERNKTDVTYSACIYCMKCIEACPEQEALSFTLFGRKVLRSKRYQKEKK